MRRYLISQTCRVMVLWLAISITNFTQASQETLCDNVQGQEYIVRVSSFSKLQNLAQDLDLQVAPLISYPNASEEVEKIFEDYYLVAYSEEASVPSAELASYLSEQSWIKSLQLNISVSLPKDRVEPQAIGSFDGSNPLSAPPHDPLYPYQWDKMITETHNAWNSTTGSSDVVIAILDSGIDTDHEDLAPNVISGYNFIDNDTICEDDNGHGTKVAGVIAAKIDNNLGIAGVAGNSKIMPIKVVNSFGNVTRSDVINAVLYAVENGANVVTMSFGFNGPDEAEEKAIEYAWNKDVFICASAGNKGEFSPNHYPSSYEHVMSVGATTEDDTRVDFSNYGDNVDVFAPGKSVWMTLMDGGYGTGSGTSYAAPQIAGLAALIYSLYPDYTSQKVFNAIEHGTDSIEVDAGQILRMNSRKAIDFKFSSTEVISDPVFDDEEEDKSILVSSIQEQTIEFSIKQPPSGNYSLRIYDLAGKVVYQRQENIVSSNIILQDLNLVSGVYFWIFQTDSEVSSGKIVTLR